MKEDVTVVHINTLHRINCLPQRAFKRDGKARYFLLYFDVWRSGGTIVVHSKSVEQKAPTSQSLRIAIALGFYFKTLEEFLVVLYGLII